MDCFTSTTKYILNGINALLGVVGVYILFVTSIGLQNLTLTYYMYVVGGITLIASIVGIVGICRENVFFTAVYVTFICISFIMQICDVFFANEIGFIRLEAEAFVNLLWNGQKEGKDFLNMDFIQNEYWCCGKNSADDYKRIDREPPQSCHAVYGDLHERGCIEAIVEYYSVPNIENIACLIITGILIIFGIGLIVRFRTKQRKYNQ